MDIVQKKYLKRRKEEIFEKCNHKKMNCDCMRKFKKEMKLIRSNIPIKYISLKMKDITHPQIRIQKKVIKKYIKKIDEYFKRGIGFYLYGQTGLAKTALGVMILKAAIDKGKTAYFIDYRDLIDFYTKIWKMSGSEKGDTEKEFEDKIYCVDYLLIDNLGSEIKTKIDFSILEKILRKRNYANLPTIITSNVKITQYSRQKHCKFPDTMKSLLKANNKEIEFVGMDYRETIQSI